MAIISASWRSSLDGVGDLGVDDSETTGADGDGVAADGLVLERIDELIGPFDRLGVVALDVRHHQGVVAAVAAERRWIAERPIRHGEVDVVEAGDEVGDVGPRGTRPVAVDVAVGGGDHEDDVRFDLAERLFEDLLGANRFGTGRLEPAGDQVAGHATAEHGGGNHQQQTRHQGDAAAADDERTETSEHRVHFLRRGRLGDVPRTSLT